MPAWCGSMGFLKGTRLKCFHWIGAWVQKMLEESVASSAFVELWRPQWARSSTHPFRCEVYGKWLHMWLAAHWSFWCLTDELLSQEVEWLPQTSHGLEVTMTWIRKKVLKLALSSMLSGKKTSDVRETGGDVVQCNQVIEGHCAKLTTPAPRYCMVGYSKKRKKLGLDTYARPQRKRIFQNIQPLQFGMISCEP